MKKQEILDLVREYWQYGIPLKDDTVPVSGAILDASDIEAVVSVVLDGWFTESKVCDAFRHELCSVTKQRHAVLVNSGSSANLLAITAIKDHLEIPDGKKVITCAVAFPTTVAPIIQNNLIPLFININLDNFGYNYDLLGELLKRDDVVGAMLTHTLGFPYAEYAISELVYNNGKFLISDCADALGATMDDAPVGSHSDMATYSFFPAHHITSLDYSEPIMVMNKHTEIEILEIGKFVETRFRDVDDWKCVSFDKNGELKFRKITGVVSHPINESLYKVTVQTGRNSIVSASHSVFTRKGDDIVPVEVSSLSVGDMIFVPNKLPNPENCSSILYTNYKRGSWEVFFEDIDVTDELGELLGYYIAEGSLYKTSKGNYNIQFTFGSDEKEYAKAVANDLLVMFDIKSRIYIKDSKCMVMASNKALYEFLFYECGNGAGNKRIPSFMFSASSSVKEVFIQAYFNGDGCEHSTYGKHIGFSKDSKTISKWLATDLYYLLLQLGINSRFSMEKGKQRDFGEYMSNCKDAYSICYSSKSIVDSDGFRCEKMNKTRKIGDLSLVKITKIEKVTPTSNNVYDLSVSGYENFVGGIGMVLHNTGEGGAVLTSNSKLYRLLQQYSNWGRACFIAGTMISTYSGVVPIEQIYFGYWVKSHAGEYKRVSKTFKRQYNGKLYEIKSKTRPTISVTSEHPFYVQRNGIKEWVCAKDLTSKDILLEAIPKRNEKNKTMYLTYKTLYTTKEEHITPNKDLARLLGYWIAEGSLAKALKGKSGYKENKYTAYWVDFSFNANEIEYIADVKSLMKKYFGVSGSQRILHKSDGISLTFKTRKGYEFFTWFGSRAETKALPGFVLDWSVDLLIEFVKGFWRGDGSSSYQGFSMFSVSIFLIEQIREVLLRCGVIGSQWKRKYNAYTSSIVNGKDITSKNELHALHIYGKNAELFGRLIGEEYIARSNRRLAWIDSEYAYYPITSITISDVQNIDVYNLEVDDDHSYHANGIAVHNCWCEPGQSNTCNKRFEQEFPFLPKGYDHKYTFTKVGYNLKMTEMQGALGLSQIKRLSTFVEKRRQNWYYLYRNLSDINEIAYVLPEYEFSPFGFPIRVLDGDARGLIAHLEKNGVRTRRIFAGNIIRHPMMDGVEYETVVSLDNADLVMNSMFWVGVWPGLEQWQLDKIVNTIKEYYR